MEKREVGWWGRGPVGFSWETTLIHGIIFPKSSFGVQLPESPQELQQHPQEPARIFPLP